MKRKVIVIIAAAGKGKRFSEIPSSQPKQYIKLFGKPIILYSLQAFQSSAYTDEIIVSASPEYFDLIHKLSVEHKISKLTKLTEGGKTRFHSVRNAFEQADCRANDIVVIHDAARPNISSRFIDSFIKLALKNKNLISGVNINSTVKKVKRNLIYGSVDRTDLWEIQTPQAFSFKTLKDSYAVVNEKNFTDESSLVQAAGFKVRITEGSRFNLKVTTLEDLNLLKEIMQPA
ncbi:MAG: 2-C-methyl-D-erythritol 4-phosphate cytidylyltransferase [Ignavibacteria bacterium]|nr:2-C-methyl-D-erythritol 4-phosphate cytidylyltransferase [Ignavibacteria bacterium]